MKRHHQVKKKWEEKRKNLLMFAPTPAIKGEWEEQRVHMRSVI